MFRHVTAWGWYWLTLLGLITVPEVYWIIVKGANTISDNIWAVEHLNLNHPFDMAVWTLPHWTIALALWTMFGWLSFHLPFGVPR